MALYAFIQQFILSILVGALVGIEREHARKEVGKKAIPIFGLRTTILFSVLGFLTSFVANLMGNNLLIILGVLLALVITTAVYASNVWIHKHTGSTTYIAMFIVFFAGLLIGLGGYSNYIISVSLSIVTTLILAAKRKMVRWTRKLTYEEIISAVKFGIIAFIILPLLPNIYIDPWNIINPYKIWFVIVVISAIYFISYILMKELSHKGLVVSSFFGGLVNGSATSYEIADWVKKKASLIGSAISSVFVACFAGQLGDLIVISFVFNNFSLLRLIAMPYGVSMLSLLILAFITYRSKRKPLESLKLESPFALKPALTFGAIYLFLVLAGGLLEIYFGQWGLLPTTVGGSLFSSSAVIASLANLSKQGTVPITVASKFVVLAASISLMIKLFWVHHAFNKKLSRGVGIGTFLTAFLMLLTLYLQLFFL